MNVVFSTEELVQAKRYDAWRDAICDSYVHVDVKATRPEEYRGFIREGQFGDVVLTDILLSEQSITRKSRHIARLDKDCYYVQFLQQGRMNVIQGGAARHSNAAKGAIFSATEPYELQCLGEVRSLYLEIPRDKFAMRFPSEQIPVTASISSTRGLGRITSEFCTLLATEGTHLGDEERGHLGNQLMDLLAFTLLSGEADTPDADGSIQQARFKSILRWIEAHIDEPDLSLEQIAGANGISLRYLHLLFRQSDMTASEWIWNRRLELCYDALAKGNGQSITEIAFQYGFNSSAHFSTLFRRKFGLPPRDIARTRQRR
ncbi:MAG: helix-turn-helix domain-containing protein [Alphaproteobacteria bacterium]|nr:MAG: helix-turn-helix domain-containing protein [Alphaproteobacteria bacterium]